MRCDFTEYVGVLALPTALLLMRSARLRRAVALLIFQIRFGRTSSLASTHWLYQSHIPQKFDFRKLATKWISMRILNSCSQMYFRRAASRLKYYLFYYRNSLFFS